MNITLIDRNEFLTPFDKLFDRMVETTFPNFHQEIGENFFQTGAYPKVNVIDYDTGIEIVAEIPGLDKNQLKIDIEEGILTIAGEKHKPKSDSGARYIRRELKQSSFKRTFSLGDLLDHKSIDAKFKNGVLSIYIDKVAPKKPDRTSIKIK